MSGNDIYDLELMRQVVGQHRTLLTLQFEALRSGGFMVGDRGFVLGSGEASNLPDTWLDYDWISEVGEDPASAWDTAVADGRAHEFDKELREMGRHPGRLVERAFKTSHEDGWLDLLDPWLKLVPVAAASVPGLALATPGGVAHGVASVFWDQMKKNRELARRDAFRELLLFNAEVQRTRILHRVWIETSAMQQRKVGSGLAVLEENGRLMIAAQPRFDSEYEIFGEWNAADASLAARATH